MDDYTSPHFTLPEDATQIDPLWNLCEDFSVFDAAALIAGYNPTVIDRCRRDTNFDTNFFRYPITLKALTNAVTNLRLKAAIRHTTSNHRHAERIIGDQYNSGSDIKHKGDELGTDSLHLNADGEAFFVLPDPDWELTTVAREDLINWLLSRGIRTGYFFAESTETPNYLDNEHPRYAPKLAAAVNAWLAMENTDLLSRKSPKQALAKWLRENAAKYRLSDDEGSPNEKGIEECAKVANWQDKGGAPKTPS